MFLLKSLFFIFVIFFSTIVSAQQAFMPYVGIDFQQKNMNFQKNYGYNIFVRKSFQNNVYVGLRLNECFSLEGGYQSSQRMSKKSMPLLGEDVLGQTVNDLANLGVHGFIVTETFIRTKGPHLNVMGFLPIDNGKTEFIASVGVASLTVKADYKQLADSDLQAYGADAIAQTVRHFSSTRVIPRYMLGVQRNFSDSLGLRVSLIYEFTSRFKQMAAKNPLNKPDGLLPGNGALRASLRNSVTYGLGVFMNF